MDVSLFSSAVDVRGTFPWGPGVTDVGLENVSYSLELESDASEQTIIELAMEAEMGCYVAQSLRSTVQTSMSVRRNGSKVGRIDSES